MLIEKKEREKMACPRSMTQKKEKKERERKDGMPKKHDPAIKSDMKRSMYLSVH